MTEDDFKRLAEFFTRELQKKVATEHGAEVAALLGDEWFASLGTALSDFARSVASRARGEMLEEAKAAVCWCEAGKRSGYHIAECPAARLRELERSGAGVEGGEG